MVCINYLLNKLSIFDGNKVKCGFIGNYIKYTSFLEMPTLGRGGGCVIPRTPTSAVAGLKEGGFNIQNLGGRGIFLKNT